MVFAFSCCFFCAASIAQNIPHVLAPASREGNGFPHSLQVCWYMVRPRFLGVISGWIVVAMLPSVCGSAAVVDGETAGCCLPCCRIRLPLFWRRGEKYRRTKLMLSSGAKLIWEKNSRRGVRQLIWEIEDACALNVVDASDLVEFNPCTSLVRVALKRPCCP